MKIAARPPRTVTAVPDAGAEAERRTRDRVGRQVLQQGPVTATQLAASLGLTPAAVRRHLDGLLAEGHVAVWEEPARQRRPRGRPARRFVLTDAGHAALSTQYDDVATAALRFLRTVAGETAVRQFADERVAELERRYQPLVTAAGDDPQARAEALAGALSADGYVAGTRPLRFRGTSVGTQLCQGHCPVQHVAREFPEFCEAETEAFSRLLGVHVQRLATLAHGEHVCTTHIPTIAAAPALPSAPARVTTGAPSAAGPEQSGVPAAAPAEPAAPVEPAAEAEAEPAARAQCSPVGPILRTDCVPEERSTR